MFPAARARTLQAFAFGGKPAPAAEAPKPQEEEKIQIHPSPEEVDYLFGPHELYGREKGLPRSMLLPRAAAQYDFYAKKFRKNYLEEGILPSDIPTFESTRERRADETIEKLMTQNEVACIVEARDEFPDVDFVLPQKKINWLKRQTHWKVRPFKLQHGDDEMLVTVKEIVQHEIRDAITLRVVFQRFIEGRPNKITIPLKPVQEEKSIHYMAGADYHVLREKFDIWTYTLRYPPIVEVDCQFLSPKRPIKIGDAEKLLPYGVYLHKKYIQQRFHAIVKLSENNAYIKRKNMILDHEEAIRLQRQKAAAAAQHSQQAKKAPKAKTSVPLNVVSAKAITAARKETMVEFDGRKMTYDEMVALKLGQN